MKTNERSGIAKSQKTIIGCGEIGTHRCKREIHEKNPQNAGYHGISFIIENADWRKVIFKYHTFPSEEFAKQIRPFGIPAY